MSTQTSHTPVLEGYQLRLPVYEGPLDVLLRLIERSQLAVSDISLISISNQFLAYLESLAEAPPETIAEFSAVAARLVLLKSRSLLPRPPLPDEETDSGDLVHQLIQYQAFKDAARVLAERDAEDSGAFAPSPGPLPSFDVRSTTKLAAYQPSSLVRAIHRRLSTVPSPPSALNPTPSVPLRLMVERVLSLIAPKRVVPLSAVLHTCRDRDEVLAAFLAVLVLIRRGLVNAEQVSLFGAIVLTRIPNEITPSRSDAAHPRLTMAEHGR